MTSILKLILIDIKTDERKRAWDPNLQDLKLPDRLNKKVPPIII